MNYQFDAKKQILTCVLLLFSTASSFANSNINSPDLSASQLDAVCSKYLNDSKNSAPLNDFSFGLCLGIIFGVEDNATFDQKICIPPTTTTQDKIAAVSSYIATQKNREKEAYASLAFDGLIAKWPCKTK